jgi:hypothetical protein
MGRRQAAVQPRSVHDVLVPVSWAGITGSRLKVLFLIISINRHYITVM